MIGQPHGLRWIDPRVDEWTRGCGSEQLLERREASWQWQRPRPRRGRAARLLAAVRLRRRRTGGG